MKETNNNSIEEGLLVLTIIAFILLILVFINDITSTLVKGFIQLFFGGKSISRTILILFLFFFFSFLFLLFKKMNLNEKLNFLKPESFLLIFIALLCLGFYFNFFTLSLMSEKFDAKSFASLVENGKFIYFELSNYEQNFLPQVSFYYFFNALGLDLGPKIGSGYASSFILPSAQTFAIVFQLIIFLLFLSGFCYIFLKMNELKFLDFVLFVFSFIGFSTLILAGSIFASLMLIHVFLFVLFLTRNYLSEERLMEKTFLPLISVSVYSFVFGHFNEDLMSSHSWYLVFALSALLILLAAIKSFSSLKRFFSLSLIAVLFFYLSLPALAGYYLDYSFGMPIEKQEILFVYGIPKNVTDDEIVNALNDLFSGVSVKKLGFLALITVKPFTEKTIFTLNTLKNELFLRFDPETFIVVEKTANEKKNVLVKLYFLGDTMPNDIFYAGQEILNLKILSVEENLSEKSIAVQLEGYLKEEQQLLVVLSFLREKGFNERVLAVLS